MLLQVLVNHHQKTNYNDQFIITFEQVHVSVHEKYGASTAEWTIFQRQPLCGHLSLIEITPLRGFHLLQQMLLFVSLKGLWRWIIPCIKWRKVCSSVAYRQNTGLWTTPKTNCDAKKTLWQRKLCWLLRLSVLITRESSVVAQTE